MKDTWVFLALIEGIVASLIAYVNATDAQFAIVIALVAIVFALLAIAESIDP